MNRKNIVRIVCLLLAVLMVVTMLSGLIGSLIYAVSAAETPDVNSNYTISFRDTSSKSLVTYLERGRKYSTEITFTASLKSRIGEFYTTKIDPASVTATAKAQVLKRILVTSTTSDWEVPKNGTVSMSPSASGEDITVVIQIPSVTNKTNNRNLSLNLTYKKDDNVLGDVDINLLDTTDLFVPESLFEYKKPTTDPDTDEEKKSDTILENYTVTDEKGNLITSVTKETPPFNLIITYLEYGLEKVDLDDIPDKSLAVFIESFGGFKSSKGSRGELTRMTTTTSDGVPRFKAVFRGLTYDEIAGNSIEFRMVYSINNEPTKGALKLIVKEAKTKEEEDEKKIAPLKPYIIVNSYSYGDEEIVAGEEFKVNLTFTNTSATIDLENIVMTVTTPETLAIASDSNTNYVAAMPAKGTLSHSISLKAKPSAEVGSAEVTIDFTYQYVDEINKAREEMKTTEKISVPITQIDRFLVDPIKDPPSYAMVGEKFYVTVNMVNKGKTSTYNISATAESKSEITSEGYHFGNLAAGKSDTLDVPLTILAPGEHTIAIVVQYEDENNKQKEIKQNFSIMVEEIVPEMPELPPDGMDDGASSAGKITIILSIVGAIFIGAPIAYFFIKRNTKKESEDFDEDF